MVTTGVAEHILETLERDYCVRREGDVADYVQVHPEVEGLLVEVRANLRRYFGDDPIALEVVHDPDDHPSEPELFALVRTGLSSGEALRRLRQFDRDWWLGALDRAKTPVVVSIEHTS